MALTKMRKTSPYELLQEIYFPDVWKMFVCNIMLNLTGRKQVDAVREEFFRRWGTPESLVEADVEEVRSVIRTLGMANKRPETLIRMTREYLKGEWKEPKQLFGLGQYAQDSYDIFYRDILPEKPSDHVLRRYVEWRRATIKENSNRYEI